MKIFTSYKTALILFFLICNQYSFSQGTGYNPFPEKYGKWIINRDGPHGPGEIQKWNLTLYETAGDTVITGLKYKKVNVTAELQNINPSMYDIWAHNFGPRQLAFAYRNDISNKKVYILTDANKVINGKLTTEYLWYNFNLKLNDTIKEVSYALEINNGTAGIERRKVNLVDSVLICGRYEKRFAFDCKAPWEYRLIEGVGFKDNFIKTNPLCGPTDPSYLYFTSFSCSPTVIPDEPESVPSVSVFPNPASHTLHLKWAEQNKNTVLDYSIVDCLGRAVLQKNNNEREEIDISALPNGLYFIILTDKQGNPYKKKFIKQE